MFIHCWSTQKLYLFFKEIMQICRKCQDFCEFTYIPSEMPYAQRSGFNFQRYQIF
jgi:hypothetical protein